MKIQAIARLQEQAAAEIAAPNPQLQKLRDQSADLRKKLAALKGKTGNAASASRTRLNKQLTQIRTKIANFSKIKKLKK